MKVKKSIPKTYEKMDYCCNPKISVIVPVYKSENYLSLCIDSILSQTYKNLEIILIDDGSPDKCPKICDEYAKKDKRIHVIHQKNKGQSAARNAGIDVSTGDCLFFVDSDDKLHSQAIEILLNVSKKTQAPIAVSNYFLKLSKKQKFEQIENVNSLKFDVHKSPVGDMLKTKYLSSIVWNKLYERKLFDKWRFIEGIKFEDWPLITCMFSEIPFYASVNVPLYFYNNLNTSTVRSQFDIHKINSYMTGIRFTYEFYQQKNKMKYWYIIRKIRIKETLKMMISKIYHTKKNQEALIKEFLKRFRELRQENIVSMRDLTLKSFFRFIIFNLYVKKGKHV